jgi:hypothetical protein
MNLEWLVIRGSGIVAFALLSSSVIWGLFASTKFLGNLTKAKALTWFHESLGISALLATVIHMVGLSIHEFLPFTWGVNCCSRCSKMSTRRAIAPLPKACWSCLSDSSCAVLARRPSRESRR